MIQKQKISRKRLSSLYTISTLFIIIFLLSSFHKEDRDEVNGRKLLPGIDKVEKRTNAHCELTVEINGDKGLCEDDTVVLTAAVSGMSKCDSCSEYKVINTSPCIGKREPLVLDISKTRNFFFFSITERKVMRNENLKLIDHGDGTAILTGYVRNSKRYKVEVKFTQKKKYSYKEPYKNACGGTLHTKDWIYFWDFTGYIKEVGGGFYMNISKKGGPAQIGKGANTNERVHNKLGSSFWIKGSNGWSGDFHLNLDCVKQLNTNLSYRWSTGERTESIRVHEPGTYTVTVSDCNNCKASDTVAIMHQDTAIDAGQDQTICLGDEAVLTVEGEGDILWSNGETTRTIIVQPFETTTYSVVLTNNGCKVEDEVVVTIGDCGIAKMKVYPTKINRNQSLIIDALMNGYGKITTSLYDLSGRKIHTFKEQPYQKGNNKLTVYMHTVPVVLPGIYILKLEGDNWIRTRRVIIGL
ncbi:T9SS type A sorting domain-containing protein [Aquimarina hainanensis]|uniref:T9SS type A sorting domain-containing protein n=1 Tax=Aquimarina hainanensis TaxID=1578017 RepID=A0ABW5N4U3_9FLAO